MRSFVIRILSNNLLEQLLCSLKVPLLQCGSTLAKEAIESGTFGGLGSLDRARTFASLCCSLLAQHWRAASLQCHVIDFIVPNRPPELAVTFPFAQRDFALFNLQLPRSSHDLTFYSGVSVVLCIGFDQVQWRRSHNLVALRQLHSRAIGNSSQSAQQHRFGGLYVSFIFR